MPRLDFDSADVPPTGTFEPIPAGEYLCVIIDSSWKDTKAGDGRYLQLEMEIVDGKHKGRYVWDRLNLENRSDKAVEIARSTLSSICHATGVRQISDTNQLHNIPMLVKVRLRDYQGEKRPEVIGYSGSRSEPVELVRKQPEEPKWDEIPF